MQRVLQISNRHSECVGMFAQKHEIYNLQKGKQYVSFGVSFEDFDSFVGTLTEAVAVGFVKEYVNKIISAENACFNRQEKDLIIRDVFEEIDMDEITSAAVRVACENSIINLDGLYYFMLRDFRLEVKDVCIRVADKYMFRNEYLDFIRTLRFFASVNYGSVDVIHVVMRSADRADLLDSGFGVYEMPETRYGCEFAIEQLFEYDSVVSSLVEASPKSIVLHNWKAYSDSDLIETLVNIFDERVCFCSGCGYCNGEENRK